MSEFNHAVERLRENGVRVIALKSPEGRVTPDALFPNNWFSVHHTRKNSLVLYLMLTENRRAERQVETHGGGSARCMIAEILYS